MTAARGLVAVTRPQPFADQTAARLQTRGYQPVVAPLLIKVVRAATVPFVPDALAVTSRAGAAELFRFPALKERPVFAVGRATADAVQDAGGHLAASADGDVDDLAALLVRAAPASVLHVCGADQAGDLVGALTSAGIQADRLVAYAMEPASTLPDLPEPLLAVLLYSPRTARLYEALATQWPWIGAPAIAMSAQVATVVKGRQVQVADAPNEDSLMAALDAFAADGT